MLLGLDLGTSSAKAALVDDDGSVVAWASAPIPTEHPVPGAAVQDPQAWMRALQDAVARLGINVADHGVRAVGLAGQLPTLCVLDPRGALLGPAITWEDDRASRLVDRLLDEERHHRLWRRSGMPLDGRYLAPMALEHYREALASGATICSAKDWVLRELTGELATDQTTAPGYGCYDLERNAWDPEALDLFRIGRQALPPIVASTETAPLSATAASILGLARGIPVAVGGADSLMAALDLCARGNPGIVAGTSGVVLAPATWEAWEELEVAVLANRPVYGDGLILEADQLVTGGVASWVGSILGLAPGELASALREADPEERSPLAAAYLAGAEQGVLWERGLAGAVVGLTTATTRADLARALIEGVGFELRRMLEVLAPGAKRVRLGGGLASDAAVAQVFADTLGLTLELRDAPAITARAAALLGGFSVGLLGAGDLERAVQGGPSSDVVPDPRRGELEAERFARWRERFPRGARWEQQR